MANWPFVTLVAFITRADSLQCAPVPEHRWVLIAMTTLKFGSLASAALVILGCAVSRELPARAGDPDPVFVASLEDFDGGGAVPPPATGSHCDALNAAGVVLPA